MKLRLRIGEVMDAKRMTVYRVAKDSGVAINTVRSLKMGDNRRVDFDTIEKVARALDVNPLELIEQADSEAADVPGQYEAVSLAA